MVDMCGQLNAHHRCLVIAEKYFNGMTEDFITAPKTEPSRSEVIASMIRKYAITKTQS